MFQKSKIPAGGKSGIWDGVTAYHWLVLVIAASCWLFDMMGQRVFVLAREPAMRELLGSGATIALRYAEALVDEKTHRKGNRDEIDGRVMRNESNAVRDIYGPAPPGGVQGGLGLVAGGQGVVQLLLGDGLLLRQGGVARDIQQGLVQGRLVPGHGRLGFAGGGLELPGIDQEHHLPALDREAFSVDLLQQVALHLGPDLGVDEAIDGADPFMDDGNILLNRAGDFHLERLRGGSLLGRSAGERGGQEEGRGGCREERLV